MSGDASLTPPSVLWAQRTHEVYLTIVLEDCKDPTIKIEPTSVYFRGVGGTDSKEHEVTIDLYDEIIPQETAQSSTGRTIELNLRKKNPQGYWPQLTKLKNRYHWLKVDFNKWIDEEESDAEGGPDDNNFEEMMRSMGDLSAANRPSFEADSDSDDGDKEEDEELPPLE